MGIVLKGYDDLPPGINMVLLYGESGAGKSTSIIQSSDKPLLYIMGEERGVRAFIDAANDREYASHIVGDLTKDVIVPSYDTVDDLLDMLNGGIDLSSYATICFDGLSYFMNMWSKQALEDEAYSAKETRRGEIRRPLAEKVKGGIEIIGLVQGYTGRLCSALKRHAMAGKKVIVTAFLEEYTEKDESTKKLVYRGSRSPALLGIKFPANMPGYFDLIGLVEKRYDSQGNVIYPPRVRFEGQGFLSKWTGPRPEKFRDKPIAGILNFQKIFSMGSNMGDSMGGNND